MPVLNIHRGAPYRAITLERDQSPSGRRECGFRIECGERGCNAALEISGPPTLPPDVVSKKFKEKHWIVSERGSDRNRCPTHAKSERVAQAAPRPNRALSAAELLFLPPDALAARNAATPPAAPKPDHKPAPRAEAQPAPVPTVRIRQPTTLKTKVFAQIGIDTDLDKIHRMASNMLRLTRQHVQNLEAFMVTVEDAQKRIGQQPAARRA